MKVFILFKIVLTLIDLSQIFPMKPSEFEISFFIKRYDEKKTLLKIAEMATLPKSA